MNKSIYDKVTQVRGKKLQYRTTKHFFQKKTVRTGFETNIKFLQKTEGSTE